MTDHPGSPNQSINELMTKVFIEQPRLTGKYFGPVCAKKLVHVVPHSFDQKKQLLRQGFVSSVNKIKEPFSNNLDGKTFCYI